MNRYQTVLNISRVPLGDVSDVVEIAMRVASTKLDLQAATLTVTFEVGPEGAAQDMWELRDVVQQLEAELGAFMDCAIEKPVEVDSKESGNA